jgi:XrtJ-associated TM-motif-TM protein
MKRLRSLIVVAIVLLSFSPATHAQGGCADSPENPTAILALVCSAGAGLALLRIRTRRK